MTYTISKVNYYEKMSEETVAFNLVVKVGDEDVAYVTNEGRGGCNNITPLGANKYSDVAWIENEEMNIMNKVLQHDFVTKNQGNALCLEKEDSLFFVRLNHSISKFKKYKPSLLHELVARYRSEGYNIINRNLRDI